MTESGADGRAWGEQGKPRRGAETYPGALRESQTCKEAATEGGRSCRVGRSGEEGCKKSARQPSSVRSRRDEAAIVERRLKRGGRRQIKVLVSRKKVEACDVRGIWK